MSALNSATVLFSALTHSWSQALGEAFGKRRGLPRAGKMPREPPKEKERPDPEGPNRASGPASTLTLNWALPGWPLGLGHICDVITPTRAVGNEG